MGSACRKGVGVRFVIFFPDRAQRCIIRFKRWEWIGRAAALIWIEGVLGNNPFSINYPGFNLVTLTLEMADVTRLFFPRGHPIELNLYLADICKTVYVCRWVVFGCLVVGLHVLRDGGNAIHI